MKKGIEFHPGAAPAEIFDSLNGETVTITNEKSGKPEKWQVVNVVKKGGTHTALLKKSGKSSELLSKPADEIYQLLNKKG